MIHIEQMKVGPMAVFSYIVCCSAKKEALVIDPAGSEGKILDKIKALGLNLKYVVNTHAHADHTCGNRAILSRTDALLVIHVNDADQMTSGKNKAFSLAMGKKPSPRPDLTVEDGASITIGDEALRVIWTPGHSPGSMCLYSEGHLFTGDTLFVGAVGRTDLAGGDFGTLLLSIKKLLSLPLETKVWPGHHYGEAPSSTLDHESKTNPYITDFL